MDLSNPVSLLSGVLIGFIGLGLLIYGKKQQAPAPLIAGLALCIFPYFVASALLMWLIAAACLGGLYLLSRRAGTG